MEYQHRFITAAVSASFFFLLCNSTFAQDSIILSGFKEECRKKNMSACVKVDNFLSSASLCKGDHDCRRIDPESLAQLEGECKQNNMSACARMDNLVLGRDQCRNAMVDACTYAIHSALRDEVNRKELERRRAELSQLIDVSTRCGNGDANACEAALSSPVADDTERLNFQKLHAATKVVVERPALEQTAKPNDLVTGCKSVELGVCSPTVVSSRDIRGANQPKVAEQRRTTRAGKKLRKASAYSAVARSKHRCRQGNYRRCREKRSRS